MAMRVPANGWFRERQAFWAKRLAARFRKNQDGAVAIEFGLVVLPFLALLFAILETALVFFAGQVLETAVGDASRLILTGQAKTQNLTAEQFKDRVCARIPALFNCKALVQVDVRAFGDSFASATVGSPIQSGRLHWGTGNGAPLYSNPGDRQIVVVRAAMEYPIYIKFFGQTMANLSNGTRLIMASATFRNEPFGG
jgi:Flp pilus assembly protein TadG